MAKATAFYLEINLVDIDERTISDLTLQKRNKERLNVFLDGEYAFSLAISLASGLSVGQVITASEIDRLQHEDSIEKAKQSAFRYLSYRPRSTQEVKINLKRKGYDERTIQIVVDRLRDLDLVNDRKFAKYWVEQRETFKPRSRLALRHELYQKGVDREIVEGILDTVDEEDAARRAGKKKVGLWSHLAKDEFLKKMNSYLQRRGFNYEIIKIVTSELWKTVEKQRTKSENNPR